MTIHTKKRDRVKSIANEEEEYERAVSFLREFHSRQVEVVTAATATNTHHLHSMSLDAILETDHFEDMLASDFSLALSVGGHNSGHDDPRPRRNPSGRSLSRMKKTMTSTCLFDLDDGVSTAASSSSGSSSGSSSDDDKSSSSCDSETRRTPSLFDAGCIDSAVVDDDFTTESYYFGYDESPMPMTKRHCGHVFGRSAS
eukprot:CAMPEP_0172309446 /NCGR_PEP_ID=MMETSP1058-20130122/9729_1 /TAXON_ID=83371 /ORGANISM="Detonula confervacea, Strain CCMP 353" /LENGTH=198 /DNA_ID=CAMNT_0013022073 /DNA_START=107 /DNA_END=703 /DNA_ORIENTATION=+